jgi:hypothetical protein
MTGAEIRAALDKLAPRGFLWDAIDPAAVLITEAELADRWTMVRTEERLFWQRVLLTYGGHTADCEPVGCSCAWSGYEAAALAAHREGTR